MDMPYKLVTDLGELGPLANDNPKSEYGLEDIKIKRSAEKLLKAFKKLKIDGKVVHYVE